MAYAIARGIPKQTIRYKGLFDFDGLYNVIVQWMKARRYWFHETIYKHKVPSPAGAEQEITFKGDKKITEFYKYEVTVKFHLWDMTEVEVEIDGVKKTLTSARLEISLNGKMLIDFEGRYGKTNFLVELRDFMLKYILRRDIENIYEDQLYYRVIKLQGVIKDYLDMQTKGNEYAKYLGDQ